MNNFDIRSAKFIGILLIMCLVFMLAVMNAYKYLPQENGDIPAVSTETNLPNDEDETSYEENTDTNTNEEYNNEETSGEKSEKEIQEATPVRDEDKITVLENISDENNQEVSSDFNTVFAKAKALKSDKQLVDALQSYEQALSLAETNSSKADCYEEIAEIYAVSKRYGKALSSAQKAYNLSPSSSREVLLARLYFKTGDIDKANTRMNNVLRRDFSLD